MSMFLQHLFIVIVCFLSISGSLSAPLSTDVSNKPLMYYDAEAGGMRYCKFASEVELKAIKDSNIEKACIDQNNGTKHYVDGVAKFPYVKDGDDFSGSYLTCDPFLHGASTCDLKIYATCTSYKCDEGYEAAGEAVTCKVTGPEDNVTAAWSLKTPCRKSAADSADSVNLALILPVTIVAVLIVVVIVIVFCVQLRKSQRGQNQRHGEQDGSQEDRIPLQEPLTAPEQSQQPPETESPSDDQQGIHSSERQDDPTPAQPDSPRPPTSPQQETEPPAPEEQSHSPLGETPSDDPERSSSSKKHDPTPGNQDNPNTIVNIRDATNVAVLSNVNYNNAGAKPSREKKTRQNAEYPLTGE